MMVATSSVEMTRMCRSGGREKAGLPVVAAEGSFGSVELMNMWHGLLKSSCVAPGRACPASAPVSFHVKGDMDFHVH